MGSWEMWFGTGFGEFWNFFGSSRRLGQCFPRLGFAEASSGSRGLVGWCRAEFPMARQAMVPLVRFARECQWPAEMAVYATRPTLRQGSVRNIR